MYISHLFKCHRTRRWEISQYFFKWDFRGITIVKTAQIKFQTWIQQCQIPVCRSLGRWFEVSTFYSSSLIMSWLDYNINELMIKMSAFHVQDKAYAYSTLTNSFNNGSVISFLSTFFLKNHFQYLYFKKFLWKCFFKLWNPNCHMQN